MGQSRAPSGALVIFTPRLWYFWMRSKSLTMTVYLCSKSYLSPLYDGRPMPFHTWLLIFARTLGISESSYEQSYDKGNFGLTWFKAFMKPSARACRAGLMKVRPANVSTAAGM